MLEVFIDQRIQKQLSGLRRTGKKGDLAARQADQIIRQLLSGIQLPEAAGSPTRHGESRLKGSIKYDLGGGYRLVTVKHEQSLYILYCGTHDDCHRWIENNRDLQVDFVAQRSSRFPIYSVSETANQKSQELTAPILEKNTGMEKDPAAKVDERMLRQIFSGIAGQ